MNAVRRGRRTLILIGLVFAAPIMIASLLAFSGWLPEGRRNYGVLVEPPQRLEVATSTTSGDAFTWTTPQWHWTLVVRIPAHCDPSCRTRLDQVGNLRISLGRHAGKLRIATDRAPASGSVLDTASGVYVLGNLPAPVEARLPAPAADVAMALVDPAGYLMLTFPERADLARVRKDLGKLIR